MSHKKLDEIERFIRGYKHFKKLYFSSDNNNQIYKSLAETGQTPKTMVVTCSDSRINPAEMWGCKPGELFVVRNVANLVPPYESDEKNHGTSAALEFAVLHLNVEHIIVLGHSQCGGIDAMFKDLKRGSRAEERSFISTWMEIAHKAKVEIQTYHADAPLSEKLKLCEEKSLLISLENLMTFPWIKSKVEKKLLTLHAWRFDLVKGIIQQYDSNLDTFIDLE